jgi:hypothetical protein
MALLSSVKVIFCFWYFADAAFVHIEYHPSRLQPLPRSICVSSRCMIPHFDIQGHSASVDLMVNTSNEVEILVNMTSSRLRWQLPSGPVPECYILKNPGDAESVPMPDGDEDEDDPLLSNPRECLTVYADVEPSILTLLLKKVADSLATLPFLPEALRDLYELNVWTWLLLGACIGFPVLLFRISPKERTTGIVRVSYTDPNRRAEYTILPNASRFPESALQEEAIVNELLNSPGYSSFSILTARPLCASCLVLFTVRTKLCIGSF